MPHFTRRIEGNGPLLNIQLAVTAPRANAQVASGIEVPQPISVVGLVDTGASSTGIDRTVVERLRLEPTGEMSVLTPSTGDNPTNVEQYDISVLIYSAADEIPMSVPILAVAEIDIKNQGFDMLIGRDILSSCVLVYNDTTGLYTLAF